MENIFKIEGTKVFLELSAGNFVPIGTFDAYWQAKNFVEQVKHLDFSTTGKGFYLREETIKEVNRVKKEIADSQYSKSEVFNPGSKHGRK